jgi:hypothetical protein
MARSVARTFGTVRTLDPLVDATDLLGDTDALRQRFLDEGHLYFRGLVDATAVERVRDDILGVIGALGWLEPGAPKHHEGSGGYWPAYQDIQRLESFHRLAFDEALRAALRTLFGGDVLPHPQKIARISFPDPDFFTAPHQDYRYIQGTPDFVTAWLPLVDCPPEQGGLRVLAGSQARGLLPVQRANGAGGLAVEADDDDPGWRTTTFAPGDAVVFGSLTIHGAIPNLADRLRLSVDYRYQLPTDAIAAPSLDPHFRSIREDLMPSWDELAAEWQSRDWCARPDDLTVTRMRNPAADDLAVPPSRWWHGT